MRNEIIGDLDAEFGACLPQGANTEDMTVQELAKAIQKAEPFASSPSLDKRSKTLLDEIFMAGMSRRPQAVSSSVDVAVRLRICVGPTGCPSLPRKLTPVFPDSVTHTPPKTFASTDAWACSAEVDITLHKPCLD